MIRDERLLVYYSGFIGSAPYPEITIALVMRRRPLYYVFTYLMPCIGCTGFVFLGFILPGECGEKVFLDIKVLLSLILFFFTVGEVMPPTATTVPLIGELVKTVHVTLLHRVCRITNLKSLTTARDHFTLLPTTKSHYCVSGIKF